MTQSAATLNHPPSDIDLDYDAIVIGAGISGLYQLYKLREIGMKVCVFEMGTGVGGTWYWNRYPGARFDSESYSYAYSFSQELLDEWDWSEHFASQPEILRYLQHVADRFDLIKDIRFSSDVRSALYSDDTRSWQIQLQDGSIYRSRFLITGIGILSEPTLPKIEGIGSFKGHSFHTSRWPHTPVNLAGKKVAVIGTGASGVQAIQEACKYAGHLTVFQPLLAYRCSQNSYRSFSETSKAPLGSAVCKNPARVCSQSSNISLYPDLMTFISSGLMFEL